MVFGSYQEISENCLGCLSTEGRGNTRELLDIDWSWHRVSISSEPPEAGGYSMRWAGDFKFHEICHFWLQHDLGVSEHMCGLHMQIRRSLSWRIQLSAEVHDLSHSTQAVLSSLQTSLAATLATGLHFDRLGGPQKWSWTFLRSQDDGECWG